MSTISRSLVRSVGPVLLPLALASCSADGRAKESPTSSAEGLSYAGVTFQAVLGGQYFSAQNGGGGAVNATATAAQSWETFTLIDQSGSSPMSGDSIFIQANSGAFFQAVNGGGSTLNASSKNQQTWETFKVIKTSGSGAIQNGDIVGLQTYDGSWVTAQNGGGGPVEASAPALSTWEQIRISGLPSNTTPPGTLVSVNFKTQFTGNFMGAQNDGGGAVIATATVAQAWETFTLIDSNGGLLASGDSVFVRAGNDQYFQAVNGGGSTLNAGSNNTQSWETFKIVKASGSGVINPGDVVGLQTTSGDWVSAANGGGSSVGAAAPALGSWESFSISINGSNGGGSAGDGGSSTGDGGGSSTGDVIGKISVGYQGWFTAAGDGSGINPPWWHWTADRNTPTQNDVAIESWPDIGDYSQTYPTGFANLNSGGAAGLYSDWDASTIDTQVQWMQNAGIDTIALQRFSDFRGPGQARDVVAAHVRDSAQAHGRKFYIMYDISGWDTFQSDLKTDWAEDIVGELGLTNSPAYAKQNGKPVVAIWGVGYTGHPGTPATTLDVITWFQSQGVYVIGGVGNDWRTADGTRWSQAGFGQVFDALDAISPWMIGVIGDDAGSDSNLQQYNEGDVAYLHARGKDYQPCVLPGDLSAHQRQHGDFMWHQFYNMIQIGSDGLYVSMFDEYNEGNQIAKTATTSASIPAGSGFVTLDEDGTQCSSDYYMRLTGDGGRMLKGQIALTATRPTSPM
jgi:hypothetical protein